MDDLSLVNQRGLNWNYSILFSTQKKENLYIKGTSLTINERTFGYGQTNVR